MMFPPVVSLCQQLVRAPSFSGDEQLAGEIAARAMRELGYDEIHIDAYGSVIGVWRGKQPGKTILLDAHLDVVAVAGEPAWQHDPFGGAIDDGKIWGRGACDDKGVLAAMLCGVARVPRESLTGEIIVSASVCEETLTGAALESTLEKFAPALVIIGEPTDLKLGSAQKGRAGIVVEAHGRSAHTSRPELGDNAVYKMTQAIQRLRGIELAGDPALGREIFELTEIVSEPLPGAGFVPALCRTRWVYRTLPGTTREQILRRLQTALAGLDGVTIQFDQLTQRCYTGSTLTMPDEIPGWRVAAHNEWQTKILHAIAGIGVTAETFAAPFGSNASVCAARGIPTFILGPGSIAQAHIIDEFIAIDALIAGERAFTAIGQACGG